MERTLASGATLSRRLLQMSRGDAAAMEPVDLTRAARNLGLTVRRLMPDNVHLALECDRDPVIVALRPGDADQILLNLVVNARDALPEGGRISVRVAAEHERAVLVVEDDGHGIAPQVMHRIFEPFFTTRTDRGGTGLGLATVKDITDKSGGRLDVQSEPGQGARFTLSWPLANQ
jgi:signal transduction histidine kinase